MRSFFSVFPGRVFPGLIVPFIVLCSSLCGAENPSLSQPSPNFIVFYTDDQGIGDLSTYGAADIPTPNLDRLASSGVRFTNWYSASPVCSPSRAALLTGRYPQRTGVKRILELARNTPGLYASELTIAKVLQGLGYRTAAFGKWHLGSSSESRPNTQGFDQFYGFHSGCIDYYSHIMYWEQLPIHDLWKNNTETWENGIYFTDIITRESLRFLNENSRHPFFLYVAYNAPHYPLHAPPEYRRRFSHLERHRQLQAAMVSTVDDSVGLILGLLKRLGIDQNTIVFFQSDNGATIEKRALLDDSREFYHGGSNAPYRGYKGGLYEGGIRMPALLSWPGHIPAGRVVQELGCTIDIFPTFLQIAGVKSPADRTIDGKNILPMVLAEKPTPHEDLFWEYRSQSALRKGKWKVILNGKESFEENSNLPECFLADLEADPGENRNLAAEKPELLKQLLALVRNRQKEVEKR
jgi:arylsulfatase A-like enzyme